MRILIWTVVALFVALLATPEVAVSGQRHPDPPDGYVLALHVANLFLTAWVERDPEAGLALMSARVLTAEPDSSRVDLRSGLRQYMSGLSNPHHEAFEIAAGRVLAADRIVFPVRLFELGPGESTACVFNDSLGVILQEGGWRVDRLPRTYDPD